VICALVAASPPAGEPASAQSPAPCPNAEAVVDAVGVSVVRGAVACAVNAAHEGHGLTRLTLSSQPALAAQRHGSDMVMRRYFTHVSPCGGTMEQRARRAS
jgi:uncharacterized protein YkwD